MATMSEGAVRPRENDDEFERNGTFKNAKKQVPDSDSELDDSEKTGWSSSWGSAVCP